MRPEDAPALVDLFGRLSSETVRRRFFGPRKMMSLEEAQRIAGADHSAHEAVVAFELSAPERVIAIGRYECVAPGTAEVSFTVEDAYQGHGLGKRLLDWLVEVARARGLRALQGAVLPENTRMLQLLRTHGYGADLRFADGMVVFEIPLR